jgi:branched-chain amino acid transport system ATP-binding protein
VNGLLEVNDLEVAYGPSQVLFGVDLAMAEGEAATLLGRNGMGKTTTLRAICGLQAVKTGSIRFAGERIDGWRPDRIGRAGIALVPEGRQVFPNLTVARAFAGLFRQPARRPRPWTPARVCELFPPLRLRAKNLGNQLSGGEQQMLAIGRALVTNPRLLILDEATEGLAPLVREEIWTCLTRLRAAGQSILVVDKYVEKLIALADRHTIIQRGQVVWQGSSAALDADHGVWHRHLGIG